MRLRARLDDPRRRVPRSTWSWLIGSYRRLTRTTASTRSRPRPTSAGRLRRPLGRDPCDPPCPRSWWPRSRSAGPSAATPRRSERLRSAGAAASWLHRRFGVRRRRRPRGVHRHQGVRRQHAAVAAPPVPDRDTVLYPGDQLPDLRDGRGLGRVPSGPVPDDSTRSTEADAERALCLWVNTPGNPTGELGRPRGGRAVGSDARSAGLQRRVLRRVHLGRAAAHDPRARTRWCVAVHSLSKRSNLAGLRAGFYAGDTELVRYLAEVRKHAGFMVPGTGASGRGRRLRRRRACRRATSEVRSSASCG